MKYVPAEPSQLTKPTIQKLAESLALQLGYEPGDDLRGVVQQLGGEIQVRDMLLSDPETTGSLYVDGPRNFTIIIPIHTSPERDRFTIAHEFGHFIVHYLWRRRKENGLPERMVAYRKESHRLEWEANWFAAAFLMPEKKFREIYTKYGGDIKAVARNFRVSSKAAEVRSEDLGMT